MRPGGRPGLAPTPARHIIRRMAFRTRVTLLACLAMALPGCRRTPTAPAEPTHSITVEWGEKSRTGDESINAFVTEAIDHCTSRNYEEWDGNRWVGGRCRCRPANG